MNSNRILAILGGIVAVLILAVVVVAVLILSRGGNGGPRNAASGGSSKGGAGQALRIPGDDPLTLDPAQVFDTTSANYVVELFGGLVTLDKDLKVVPDVAKSMPDVSSDGKTYTFHLRDDVVFTGSNRKVTAQDFKYSLERAADPKTDSPTADTYLGDIVGAKDMIRGKATSISGIKVVDDSTLQIQIDAPKPYFLAKMTYTTAFVVDKQQIDSDPKNWTRHPNGTGPFILKEWNIGQNVTLVPNTRYHLGVPDLKEVDYNLAGGSSLTEYENNEVDVTGVGINDIERMRDQNDPLHKEFHEKPALSVGYIAFNTQKAPFDDLKVRQAFSQSIDKEQLINVILKNEADNATGILPPAMPGFSKDTKGLPYNVNTAKQLLQDSKYAGKLPPIQLTLSGQGATVDPLTEAIIQMWKTNLDVDVTVQQEETATFFSDAQQGKLQMYTEAWGADYADPQDFLSVNFLSDSQQNESKYSSPQVDALLRQADTTLDNSKRMDLYHQAEQMIINDAPWIPLTWDKDEYLVKPYVKGYDPVGLVIPLLRFVSVQK
ncbi:MAG TPA: peptide ABC transporter substrate-binding protein [Dehalococcoidia bacterium]|nr:peptide ABC transporter substrate-binding protein [Dehalococcoidia bacterium]